jgi:hypothetical protein
MLRVVLILAVVVITITNGMRKELNYNIVKRKDLRFIVKFDTYCFVPEMLGEECVYEDPVSYSNITRDFYTRKEAVEWVKNETQIHFKGKARFAIQYNRRWYVDDELGIRYSEEDDERVTAYYEFDKMDKLLMWVFGGFKFLQQLGEIKII